MDIFVIASELQVRYTNGVEHCGFVVDDTVIETQNVAVDPQNNFEISEADVERYLDVAQATWHSHTDSNPNLSLDDYLLFSELRECHHFIVARGGTWVYYTNDSGVLTVEARINA